VHVTCFHSQRASGPFFLVLLVLRMKIICSFRVPGTNSPVVHHHIPEQKSSNYTAVKTAQLTCKYIFIYSGSSIWGLYQKVGLYKCNIYEGIFPDKNVIQVLKAKSNMADFQYQPCITLDSAQRNR
jgi:hypothetical protein